MYAIRSYYVALLVAAVLALALSNSPAGPWMETLWTMPIGFVVGSNEIIHPLRHWINDGLLTIFFFVVGLEIKRELVEGELKDFRSALLPLTAAMGGMVVPALLFLLFSSGPEARAGWGIVMATDVAFVIGSLALLRNNFV